MSHTEGGWPGEIDPTEMEQVLRYRKKKEKDEEYIKDISKLGAAIEDLVKQNNAIDIYEDYFEGGMVDHSSEAPYAKTVARFQDPHMKYGRGASYISWYPDGARKLAIAYSIMKFQQQPANMPPSSYIWDVNRPTDPEFELEATFPLCCLNFNNKDPNILGGGQYNGQLAYWDVRKGHVPVETSPIEHSHKDPVYDMAWMQSKTGTECMTCSTDGNVFWWDIRRLGEPVETLQVKEKNSDRILGAVSMEYEAVAGPSKFLVGTEQGSVISCNRKAKTPADRVTGSYSGHHGPVNSVERNPFFPKYFVSIGDWTAKFWSEDLKTPIMSTRYHSSYLNGGCWSNTRPGVLFTIKGDGCLDVWDYFHKQNDPLLQVRVGNAPLTSFNLQDAGRLISVGTETGDVALLELCEGLAVMQPNEKQGISQMFEREYKREKNLEQRAKELKQKARKEAAKAAAAQQEEAVNEAEVLQTVEDEFFSHVKAVDAANAEAEAATKPGDAAPAEH